jgi:type IV secretory pathway TrbD component
MVDMNRHKQPVRRSLLPREMMGGVPQAGLLVILMLALVFIYGFEIYVAAVPLALLYLVMRHLSKKDQWLIDNLLENIMQKDKLIP